MKLGIFAKTFQAHSAEAVLDAVGAHHLPAIQFNMACAGLASMPDTIGVAVAGRIREACQSRKIEMAALSGTFNMIHPDPGVRREGLRRLNVLASRAREMGTSVITLCTGTRDRENMWRHHPDNEAPEAWCDLISSMAEALEIAGRHDVSLGVEPEPGNVISSARKCRVLLDTFNSPRLGVVLDPANLIGGADTAANHRTIAAAVELLGREVVLAHAKDRDAHGEVRAPGRGVVDFGHYLRQLHAARYRGPLIMHGLTETEVDQAASFLRREMQANGLI